MKVTKADPQYLSDVEDLLYLINKANEADTAQSAANFIARAVEFGVEIRGKHDGLNYQCA